MHKCKVYVMRTQTTQYLLVHIKHVYSYYIHVHEHQMKDITGKYAMINEVFKEWTGNNYLYLVLAGFVQWCCIQGSIRQL
jgi:hypothetical protein